MRRGCMWRRLDDRLATSAASARSSVRAFCLGILLSRMLRCVRSALRPELMRWWRRSTAANATCARCLHAPKIWIRKRVRAEQAAGAGARGLRSRDRRIRSRHIRWRSFARADAQAHGAARIGEFNNIGPLVEYSFAPQKVKVLLKQNAGAPSIPVVKSGDHVRTGDLLAVPDAGQTRRADSRQHRGRREGNQRFGVD